MGIDEIRNAVEVLRTARNNMGKDEYQEIIIELIDEDFNRYEVLMIAGNIAKELFIEKCEEVGIYTGKN